MSEALYNISIGADHGGVDLKDAIVVGLQRWGHEVTDHGTHGHESVDYPDFGRKVAEDVSAGRSDYGIVVCTTGSGIAITANKVHGVRCAVVYNEDSAEYTRRHNDANVIAFGQKYQTPYLALRFLKIFFNTAFEGGGRHDRRVSKITAIENDQGR